MDRRSSPRKLSLVLGLLWAPLFFLSAPTSSLAQPGVAKNYTLREVDAVSKSIIELRRDGQESIRIEQSVMRTSDHPMLVRWRERLERLRDKPALDQLEAINDLINGTVKYREDYANWNTRDRWGFPVATMIRGGDCEDFAILKGICMSYLNWPPESMYVVLGQTTFSSRTPIPHAILMAVLPDGSQVLLDCQEKRVLPPADFEAFKPMMALQRNKLYTVLAGSSTKD